MSMPRPFLDRLTQWLEIKWRTCVKRMIYLRKIRGYAFGSKDYFRRRRLMLTLPLAPHLEQPLASLRENGYVVCRDLLSEELLNDLRQSALPVITNQAGRQSQSKSYFSELLPKEALSAESPFIRFALQKDIITLVAHYLGHVPHLNNISLFATQKSDSPDWRVSQRWHRDYDDRRIVKLFTFMTEVKDESNGPFTFIPASYCDTLREPIFPVHKPDIYMDLIAPDRPSVAVYGPSLTSILIDTHRCLHFGSRITDDTKRVAYQACYTTCAPYYHHKPVIAVPDEAPKLNKAVLT